MCIESQGSTLWSSWWGCIAQFSNLNPISDWKLVILHTCFQAWLQFKRWRITLDNAIGFPTTYPLDTDVFSGSRWQGYLTKSCQQIWVRVNQHFILYSSHLRRNSNLRRCFYHTDLRQNAVFQNFSRQIALIQYSEPSKHAWAFSKTVQKISKITYTASRFSLLTSAKFSVNIKRVTLQHSKEFIVYFLFNGFITICNLKKRLIGAAFWVLLQAMFMHDW